MQNLFLFYSHVYIIIIIYVKIVLIMIVISGPQHWHYQSGFWGDKIKNK